MLLISEQSSPSSAQSELAPQSASRPLTNHTPWRRADRARARLRFPFWNQSQRLSSLVSLVFIYIYFLELFLFIIKNKSPALSRRPRTGPESVSPGLAGGLAARRLL
jgi:hypothetical protein